MIGINCPVCKERIGLEAMDLLLLRLTSRKCRKCGAELEIAFSIVILILFSFAAGALIIKMASWWSESKYIHILISIVLSWLLGPVLTSIVGKWRRNPYDIATNQWVLRWGRVSGFFTFMMGAAGAVAAFWFASYYRHLLSTMMEDDGAMEKLAWGLRHRVFPALIVAGGACVLMFLARLLRINQLGDERRFLK